MSERNKNDLAGLEEKFGKDMAHNYVKPAGSLNAPVISQEELRDLVEEHKDAFKKSADLPVVVAKKGQIALITTPSSERYIRKSEFAYKDGRIGYRASVLLAETWSSFFTDNYKLIEMLEPNRIYFCYGIVKEDTFNGKDTFTINAVQMITAAMLVQSKLNDSTPDCDEFGKGWDEYEECDNCPIRDKCHDTQFPPKKQKTKKQKTKKRSKKRPAEKTAEPTSPPEIDRKLMDAIQAEINKRDTASADDIKKAMPNVDEAEIDAAIIEMIQAGRIYQPTANKYKIL